MYKIKLVQENPKVGDIQGNLDLAKSHIIEAKEKGVNLIVFSEMFLTGYPPEDLLLREDFLVYETFSFLIVMFLKEKTFLYSFYYLILNP